MSTIKLQLILFFVLGAIFSAEATAQDASFPASWAGDWMFTYTQKDCNTGQVLGVTSVGKTINDGDLVKNFDADLLALSSLTATITDSEMTAGGSDVTVVGSCTYTDIVALSLTRTGNYINGTKGITQRADGVCTGGAGVIQCDLWEITAVRAVSPANPSTWGAIKALYE